MSFYFEDAPLYLEFGNDRCHDWVRANWHIRVVPVYGNAKLLRSFDEFMACQDVHSHSRNLPERDLTNSVYLKPSRR